MIRFFIQLKNSKRDLCLDHEKVYLHNLSFVSGIRMRTPVDIPASELADSLLYGLRNRESVLDAFQNLFRKRRHDPDFKEAFVALLVNLDQMRAPDFQKKIDYNTDVTFKLIMKIDRSLNNTQRVYLLKHIGTLAADFEKLSCDPVQIRPKQ